MCKTLDKLIVKIKGKVSGKKGNQPPLEKTAPLSENPLLNKDV